jgi:hypothetical protein
LKVMKTIRSLIAQVVAGDTRHSAASRPRARRDPLCEVLEGRQLLSTVASSVATRMPAWGSMGAIRHSSGGSPTAAEISHFGNQGGHSFHGIGSAELAHSFHGIGSAELAHSHRVG